MFYQKQVAITSLFKPEEIKQTSLPCQMTEKQVLKIPKSYC